MSEVKVGFIDGDYWVSSCNGDGTHLLLCKLEEVPSKLERLKELEAAFTQQEEVSDE